MRFSYFLGLLNKYKRYVLIIVILTIVIAEFITLFKNEEYKVVVKWLIEKSTPASSTFNPSDNEGQSRLQFNELKYQLNETSLEAEIMYSKEALKELHKMSKLPYSYYTFRNNLEITGEYGPFITFRFLTDNLEESKRIFIAANALYKEFLARPNINYHTKNVAILEQLKDESYREAEKIKNRLKKKEIESKTVSPETNVAVYQHNLTEYNSIIEKIKNNQAYTETLFTTKMRQLKVPHLKRALERSAIATDKQAIAITTELSSLKIRLVNYKTRYTDEHKDVIDTKEQIKETEKAMAKEYSRVLNRNVSVKELDKLLPFTPIQHKLTMEIVSLDVDRKALRTELDYYQKKYKEAQDKLEKTSEVKYELLKLRFLDIFHEKKLAIIKNYLLSEKLNTGLSKYDYIYTEIETPFIKKIQPNYLANFFYALLFGLLTASIMVLLLDTFNPKITSTAYIEEQGLRIIENLHNTKNLIYSYNFTDKEIADYNSLKIYLQHIQNKYNARSYCILNSLSNNSHSIILTNLAYLTAKSGLRTVLIDLNLNSPQIDRLFNIEVKENTLNKLFQDHNTTIEEVTLKSNEAPGLDLIISEQLDEVTTDVILSSNRLKDIIQELKDKYDFVFINAKSIDDKPVMKLCDYRILLIKLNQSERSVIQYILKLSESFKLHIKDCLLDTND
jgi:capsular polysaccharide biosynthesis protein